MAADAFCPGAWRSGDDRRRLVASEGLTQKSSIWGQRRNIRYGAFALNSPCSLGHVYQERNLTWISLELLSKLEALEHVKEGITFETRDSLACGVIQFTSTHDLVSGIPQDIC